jgi:uncharacterized protein (DUF1810 family)
VTDPDLVCFVEAKDSVRRRVLEELTAGHKQTQWMWFIFPQLAGLGHSVMAERYAIRDLEQAKRYLADPILGDRLRHDVRLMLRHKGKSALQILALPTTSNFGLARRSLLTRLRTKMTGHCSSKRWISSIRASRILARSSCFGAVSTRQTSQTAVLFSAGGRW